MQNAIRITVKGRVQGVGFRPFIFSLADKYQVTGTVQNNMDGVKIHAEAAELETLFAFVEEIKTSAPRLAKISEIKHRETPFIGYSDFQIIPSDASGSSSLVIPIDAAVCDNCLAEMDDPDNFRYQYPFINCTQCGSRYTIIADLPYDRPLTSMANFLMCTDCAKEYDDPMNRRHHAQPIACPNCGPQLQLFQISGKEVLVDNLIAEVRKLLLVGKIIAIKGLGGYHLCCDATNEQAVQLLRERKGRPKRPLAIMTSSVTMTKKIAKVSAFEEETLRSPEAPIVLLQKKLSDIVIQAACQEKDWQIASNIAPNVKKIGVMQAYTPLHYLLLDDIELPFIVATSANPSGLPILHQDQEAFTYLENIADYVLMHNREILHPIDDSVVECNGRELILIRRSRGFSPDPITVSSDVDHIVAFGGQMKNTFAIGRGEQMIIGPHIGEMDHLEMEEHFIRELNHLLKWTNISQKIAVIDQHPLYATRKIAQMYDFEQIVEVQHHHAHMAGCLEENQLVDDCFGIILDGTGYGLDGHIWGFEIFHGNRRQFKRLAHLAYSPLPGGDLAIREPWRNAVAMLISYFGEIGMALAIEIFPEKKAEIAVLNEMIAKQINTPLAGTCGRLFDAVSALTGICLSSTYDGEAAIELSELAVETNEHYDHLWQNNTLSISKMLVQIITDIRNHVDVSLISGKFQRTIVNSLIEKIQSLADENPSYGKKVVLSGGSFHNLYLLREIRSRLTAFGFTVYTHKQVPTGDGGLSYGQLVVSANQRKHNC